MRWLLICVLLRMCLTASTQNNCLRRKWMKFPYTGSVRTTISGKKCKKWSEVSGVTLWTLRAERFEKNPDHILDQKFDFGYSEGTQFRRFGAPTVLHDNVCASGCPVDPLVGLEKEKWEPGGEEKLLIRDTFQFCQEWVNRGPWCFTDEQEMRAEECYFVCEDLEEDTSCIGKLWASRWWSLMDAFQKSGPLGLPQFYLYTSGGVKGGPALNSYQGKRAKSISGKDCVEWSKAGLQDSNNKLYYPSNNFCRQPFHQPRPYGPYCFVEKTDENSPTPYLNEEPCFPICEDNLLQCSPKEMGNLFGLWLGPYGGSKNVSISGRPCQPWSERRKEDWTEEQAYGFTQNICSSKYWTGMANETGGEPSCYVSESEEEKCVKDCGQSEEIFHVPEDFKNLSCITDDVYDFFRRVLERGREKPGEKWRDPTFLVPDLPVEEPLWLNSKAQLFFQSAAGFQVMKFPKSVSLGGSQCVEKTVNNVTYDAVCQILTPLSTVFQLKEFPWRNVPWCYTSGGSEAWDLCYSLCSHDEAPCVPFVHDKNHPFTPESATPFSVPADAPKRFPGIFPRPLLPYRGRKKRTRRGKDCVSWHSVHHNITDPEGYYKERPGNRCFNGLYILNASIVVNGTEEGVSHWWINGGPWCFTNISPSEPSQWEWDYCFDMCDYKEEDGGHMDTFMHDYIFKYLLHSRHNTHTLTGYGRRNKTASGIECRRGTAFNSSQEYFYGHGEKDLSPEIRFLEPCQIGSGQSEKDSSLDFVCEVEGSERFSPCWDTSIQRHKDFLKDRACGNISEAYDLLYSDPRLPERCMDSTDRSVTRYPETETEKRFRFTEDRYIGCRPINDHMEWYQGTQAITLNGEKCQRWDSQVPHPHNLTQKDFAEVFGVGSLRIHEDYCRNPDRSPGGPWCLTLNRTVMREPCFQVCINREMEGMCLRKDGWPWIDTNCKKRKGSSRPFMETSCQTPNQAPDDYGFLWKDGARGSERAGQFRSHRTMLKESLYISRPADYRTPYCVRSESAMLMGPWTYIETPEEERWKYIKMASGDNDWLTKFPTYSEFDDRNLEVGMYAMGDCRGKCWMRPCFTACEDTNLKCIPRKALGLYNYQGPKNTSLSGKPCLRWNDTALNERYRNTIWNWMFWNREFSDRPKKKPKPNEYPAENFLFELQLKMMSSSRCLNLRIFMDPDNLPLRLPEEFQRGPFCFVRSGEVEIPEPCFPVCEDLFLDTRGCIPPSLMKEYLYTGYKSVSISGGRCNSWRTRSADTYIPWHLGDLGERYCRNPDGDERGPWCLGKNFTKEYCFRACTPEEGAGLSRTETGEEFAFNPCSTTHHPHRLSQWCHCEGSECDKNETIPRRVEPTDVPLKDNGTERGKEPGLRDLKPKYEERVSWVKANIVPVLLAVVAGGTYLALAVATVLGCLAFRRERKEIKRATKKRIAILKEQSKAKQ